LWRLFSSVPLFFLHNSVIAIFYFLKYQSRLIFKVFRS
jgi:hypothetical protein